MISYAQNFEDVMLWRALKHVERGFYIDIGAQDPVVDSVSLGFYEQGWRGVHVEPTPAYAQALRDARPDETVVQAAIGHENELIPFFEIAGTGISTGDAAIAHRHEAAGYANKRIDVPCIRLSSLLDNYQGRDIHWMKIDVEGMELSVLRSWAPSTVRPWIVVLESTLPLSQELSHGSWEEIVLGQGYRFAYFDGLNRFYVSEQHEELLEAFVTPPNVFDGFALAGTGSHSFCAKLNEAIARARAEVDRLKLPQTELEEHLRLAPSSNDVRSRVAELERLVAEQAALSQQRIQELVAHQRHLDQTLLQMEQAKVERLELIRHLGARDHAHASQVEALQQESAQLRKGVAERDAFLIDVRLQLVAAQTSASRMQSELAERRDELERTRRESRDNQDRERRLLAERELLEQRRAAEDARHFEERFSIEASHRDRERAWGLQSASLEAALREQLQSQQLLRLRLEQALDETRRELIELSGSMLFRIAHPWRKRREPSRESLWPASPIVPIEEEFQQNKEPQPNPSADPTTQKEDTKMNQQRSASPVANSIEQLLSLEGESFVRGAYLSVLGRPADKTGLAGFLKQLRSGADKEQLIAALADSPEGKNLSSRRSVELAALLARAKRNRPSLLRRAFRKLAAEALRPLAAQLEATESQLSALAEASRTRFDRLDAAIRQLGHLEHAPIASPAHRGEDLEHVSAASQAVYAELRDASARRSRAMTR